MITMQPRLLSMFVSPPVHAHMRIDEHTRRPPTGTQESPAQQSPPVVHAPPEAMQDPPSEAPPSAPPPSPGGGGGARPQRSAPSACISHGALQRSPGSTHVSPAARQEPIGVSVQRFGKGPAASGGRSSRHVPVQHSQSVSQISPAG